MKLSPINNTNFGYNYRLNQKLKQKLDKAPQTPTIRTVRDLNSYCNSLEDRINTLEDFEHGGVDKNEEEINILLSSFMNAKRNLCKLVDRLFPELGFSKKTLDTLDEEDYNKPEYILGEENQDNEDKLSYNWRSELYEDISADLDERSLFISTPEKYLSGVGVGYGENGDFQNLLEKFEPFSSSPKSFDDVIGLDECIEDIKDLILFPLKEPQKAKQREIDYGISIPTFTVLYGPPGCGKTMLTEALAVESGCDMYSFDLSKLGSSYVNGTVLRISKAFKEAEELAKKSKKPIILFMDEMDSLLRKRKEESGSEEDNKAVNTLLPLIVKAKDKNILIIGATNMYNTIDSAALRRSKFEVYIGLPKQDEIKKLLIKKLSSIKMGEALANNNEAITRISKKLVGYSPSNIVNMIEGSAKYAYRASREIIENDFYEVLAKGNWQKIDEQEYLPENKKRSKSIGF